jgi:hypothetical protein
MANQGLQKMFCSDSNCIPLWIYAHNLQIHQKSGNRKHKQVQVYLSHGKKLQLFKQTELAAKCAMNTALIANAKKIPLFALTMMSARKLCAFEK